MRAAPWMRTAPLVRVDPLMQADPHMRTDFPLMRADPLLRASGKTYNWRSRASAHRRNPAARADDAMAKRIAWGSPHLSAPWNGVDVLCPARTSAATARGTHGSSTSAARAAESGGADCARWWRWRPVARASRGAGCAWWRPLAPAHRCCDSAKRTTSQHPPLPHLLPCRIQAPSPSWLPSQSSGWQVEPPGKLVLENEGENAGCLSTSALPTVRYRRSRSR